jgi:hypothetical protein
MPLQAIGNTSDFLMFVRRPEVCPKMSRRNYRASISLWEGFTKMAASSAYNDILMPLSRGPIGCKIPFSATL